MPYCDKTLTLYGQLYKMCCIAIHQDLFCMLLFILHVYLFEDYD